MILDEPFLISFPDSNFSNNLIAQVDEHFYIIPVIEQFHFAGKFVKPVESGRFSCEIFSYAKNCTIKPFNQI